MKVTIILLLTGSLVWGKQPKDNKAAEFQKKFKTIAKTKSYSDFVKEALSCAQSSILSKCLPNYIGKTTLEDFVELSNNLNGVNEKHNAKIRAFADPIISKTVTKCLGNQPEGFQLVENDNFILITDDLACHLQKLKDGKWQLDRVLDIGY